MVETGRNKSELPYFSEEGKFIPRMLADEIMLDFHFVTHEKMKEIHVYDDGVYVPNGETVIEEEARNRLEEYSKTHYVNETVNSIQQRTYVPPEEFNNPMDLIAVENGLLDTKERKLYDHTPEEIITTKIPIEYDEEAECPKILEFLEETVHNEDIPKLQEFAGYCLYKDYPIHKALMLTGGGSNGKSVFLNLLKEFLGRENVSSPSLYDLVSNRFAKSELYGKLANIHADIPPKKMKTTGAFKMLTGRDQVYAEKKHKQGFHFTNHAKLIFSANEIPETKDKSRAFFRRWLLVDFPYKFVDDPDPEDPYEKRKDPHKLEKIATDKELSGFLNWALDGLDRLMEQGEFSERKSIDEREEMWERMSDPIVAFKDECLEMNPDEQETKDNIYRAYVRFCRDRNVPVKDKNVFAREVPRKLGLEATRPRMDGKRTPCWKGAMLKEEWRTEEEEEKNLESF